MKKKLRRLLCVALVAMLVVGVMPVNTVITANAASVSDNSAPEENGSRAQDTSTTSGDITDPTNPAEGTEDPANPAEDTEDPANPAEGTENPAEDTEDPANPAEGTEDPANPAEGTEDPANPAEDTEDPANPTEDTADTSGPSEDTENPAAEGTDSEEEPVTADFTDMTVFVKGASGVPCVAVNDGDEKIAMTAADEEASVYWYTFEEDIDGIVSAFTIYDDQGVVVTAPDEERDPDFSEETPCYNKENGMWESFAPEEESGIALLSVSAGQKIYFDTNNVERFVADNAVPCVIFKNSDGDTGDATDWLAMTWVEGTIYSCTVPENCNNGGAINYLQFRRSDPSKGPMEAGADWNSGTVAISISNVSDTQNMFRISSWDWSSWENNGSWVFYNDNPAPFAGKMVYVRTNNGTPRIQVDSGSQEEMIPMPEETDVYYYVFSDELQNGRSFSVIDGNGSSVVANKTDFSTAAPCYDVTQSQWVAYTPPVSDIIFGIDSPENIIVWGVKADGTYVQLPYDGAGSFTYTFAQQALYTGLSLGWDLAQMGNRTKIWTNEEIKEEAAKPAAELYVSDVFGGTSSNRYSEWRSITITEGDASLNIPEGTFKKDPDLYYASATLYDYYSDVELGGLNRKTLEDAFDSSDGSADKIQARAFNLAVSQYFDGRLEGTNFKPLYFGEFWGMMSMSGYYQYDIKYNNSQYWQGPDNSWGTGQAHPGLVDSELHDDNITMNNIPLPYFNAEFLRGDNRYNANIGQVFENVQFPFKMNEEGYWEFDSAQADQTLRLKQDTGTSAYYLDRVGVANVVNAVGGELDQKGPGFFPFNDSSESWNAKKLNYAFGMRMDIPFRMTEDGTYEVDGEKQDIVYEFAGDDDVWIFIDGKLVLDIGGDHERVKGVINFADPGGMRATVYNKSDTTYTDELNYTIYDRPAAGEEHVLTMFYMERGLWESNMKVTFNFPTANEFLVEKKVDTSDVNDLFINAIKGNLSAFDIAVSNQVTRGEEAAESSTGAAILSPKSYNDLSSAANVTFAGSPAETSVTGTDESHTGVLRARWAGKLEGTSNAAEHRIGIRPADGSTFDAEGRDGYLQFYMKNEGDGSTGVPYIDMVDANGNKIAGWANGANAWQNSNNTLLSNKWITVKIDLQALKGNAAFDFTQIQEIGIAYWDNGAVCIDDITFHQGGSGVSASTAFGMKQYQIPAYGSAEAKSPQTAVGAIYDLQGEAYAVDNTGVFSLSDGNSASFVDQFRLGSYILLKEDVDQRYYTTTWELFEGLNAYASGSGAVIDDKRTELETSAYEDIGNMDWLNVSKPDGSMLYRSYSEPDAISASLSLRAVYTNKVNTGSIKISKVVDGSVDADTEFTFTVTFENIFGQIDETLDPYTFKLKAGESLEITGIPVGTDYTIEESIPAGADYAVQDITHNDTGDDTQQDIDLTAGRYKGSISLGAAGVQDEIVFTNAPKAATVDKVFYVESGVSTELPMDLAELGYCDTVAKPEDTAAYGTVNLSQTTAGNVTFDTSKTGVANEKYTFTYNGTESNSGRAITGTVTVYTYKTSDDIYVFDYGLKSDLADTSHGNGMFQNDILFNESAQAVATDQTTASFTGLSSDGEAWSSVVENSQSKITASDSKLSLGMVDSNDVQKGAELTDSAASIEFEPTAFMDQVETVRYRTTVLKTGKDTVADARDGVELEGEVTVMPASVVYYEDNFIAIAGNGTEQAGEAADASQSNGQDEQYGHDDAYNTETDTGDSGNSSTIICSNKYYEVYTDEDGNQQRRLVNLEGSSGTSDSVSFEFSGTGFEIIGRSTTTSAVVTVMYRAKDVTGSSWKILVVDTYFANGDLYQVPVIAKTDLEYGKYEVKIAVTTSSKGNTFYLDGVRIYNPLGVNASDDNTNTDGIDQYNPEEQYAAISNLREMLLGDGAVTEQKVTVEDEYGSASTYVIDVKAEGRSAVLVELGENGAPVLSGYTITEDLQPEMMTGVYTATLNGYLAKGPNYEVYLGAYYGVAFVVEEDPAETERTLQVEAKKVDIVGCEGMEESITLRTLDGNYDWVAVETGNTDGEIISSTAMYYNIDLDNCIKLEDGKYLVVLLGANNEENSLAITNIKSRGYNLSQPEIGGDNVVTLPVYTAGTDAFEATVETITIANPKIRTYAGTITIVVGGVEPEVKDRVQLALYLDSATVPEGSELTPATIKAGAKPKITYTEATKELKFVYATAVKMPTTVQTMTLTVVPQLVKEDGTVVDSIYSGTKLFASTR